MLRRPPISTLTDTLCPDTTLVRADGVQRGDACAADEFGGALSLFPLRVGGAGHDDRIGVVAGGGCGGKQGKGNKQAHGRFSRWFDARLANRREKSTIWLPAPETGVGRARAVERAFAAPPSVAAAFDETQARPFGAADARREARQSGV